MRDLWQQETEESTTRGGSIFFREGHRSVHTSMQQVTEYAVLPSEIEQLPDFTGYLKTASRPKWRVVKIE